MVIPLYKLGRSLRTVAVALLGLAFLASCAGPKAPAPEEELPTLSEIAPRTPLGPQPRPEAATQPGGATRQAGSAVIHRVGLPLDAPLLELWELTDTRGLDGAMADRWRANGIRVGVLDLAKMPEFSQALPRGASRLQSEFVASATTLTLRAGPPLREPRAYELTLPDGTVRTQRARRGSFQFAADLQPRPVGGGLDVRIAPHHHYITPALVPRPPQETELDGRLFEELLLSAELPPGRALVLGLDPPELGLGSIPIDAEPTSVSEAAPVDSVGGAAAFLSGLRLGDLLFSGAHAGRDTQLLLIIEPSSWFEEQLDRRQRGESRSPRADSK